MAYRFLISLVFAWVAAVAAAPQSTGSMDASEDPVLTKGREDYAAARYKTVEEKLNRWLRTHGEDPDAEEAMVLLADAQIRLGKYESAGRTVQKFRKAFTASAYMPRMAYVQGLVYLKAGRNLEAGRALAVAIRGARTEFAYEEGTQALHGLVEQGGLNTDDLRTVYETLQTDLRAGPYLLQKLAEELQRTGKFSAARQAYETYLDRYPKSSGASEVKSRLETAKALAAQRRSLLVMGPMTGDYADIGRSEKEGVILAVEEARARIGLPVEISYLDDAGNMMTGIEGLRKTMQQEPFEAIVGPAMSDVSAAVAVDLSARQSPIPMITPTATTHGIAGLGKGIFQINVTTLTLGETIASHAVDCLKYKDFVIVAPKSEYGYQLAEAFSSVVEQKGGKVLVTRYYDVDATDIGDLLADLRKEMIKNFFEQRRADGYADPEAKLMRSYQNDSVFSVDAFFLPATQGEEAYRVASQIQFNKLRGAFLGSSGWYDKALLMKSSPVSQGAIFSVDYTDNPKTEIYQTFVKAYQAKWRRAPDRVAALSYDAARLALDGFAKARDSRDLIPALGDIKTFEGVLGPIVFQNETGANQGAALVRIDKKSFKPVSGCEDAGSGGGKSGR